MAFLHRMWLTQIISSDRTRNFSFLLLYSTKHNEHSEMRIMIKRQSEKKKKKNEKKRNETNECK